MDDIFHENALFGGISKEEFDQLNLPIEECRFSNDEIVFEEGALGEHVYLVASGAVRISKRGRAGKQETLTIKEPGEFFGEMALLHDEDEKRSARATAVGTTVLGRMDRKGLDALMGHSPAAAIHFTRLIASQLRSANTLFIKELVNAERLSLVGTMMGAMVHDFRNPIATISMVSHYLRSRTDNERMVELGDLTGEAADQMLVMIQELLDYSKGEVRLDLKPTTVADLMRSIDEQMLNSLHESGITVERQVDYDGEIIADRSRAIRLLCNIIKNAVDAMGDGGTLTLRVGKTEGLIRFEIEDTGCGVPEEVLARIFEPFVTHGKVNGTGLGMAIVKSVVEAHKGEIRIESQEGRGTTCQILLPADPSLPG